MKPQGDSQSPENLSQLQRWFQSVITHPDGVGAGAESEEAQRLIQLTGSALENVITRSRALTAAERLAIYANAYHTRLLECLGEVFPLLKRTLGEEAFNSLGFAYLQDYPSKSYTLNELGRHFTPYLKQTKPSPETSDTDDPDSSTPVSDGLSESDWADFLVDLAHLEWNIYEVFDGEGTEGKVLLSAEQVRAIPPERWPEAKINTAVCLRLLSTRFPVNDFYTTLRRARDDQSVPIPAAFSSFVALTRREFIVRRYNLSRPEFELLSGLQTGLSVNEALEKMVSAVEMDSGQLPQLLQLWFRNWTAEGFFDSVSVRG